eukprot:jgi/Tetstr1/432435/TSEL_002322.t1
MAGAYPITVLNIESYPPTVAADCEIISSPTEFEIRVATGGVAAERITLGLTKERILTVSDGEVNNGADASGDKVFKRAISLPKSVDEWSIKAYVAGNSVVKLALPKRCHPIRGRGDGDDAQSEASKKVEETKGTVDSKLGTPPCLADDAPPVPTTPVVPVKRKCGDLIAAAAVAL